MFKKLKTNKLLSGSAIYLISNILNAMIPFVLLPVLTRYLAPSEYGEVAMFQTLIGVLGAFIGLSVGGAAARKYYDDGVSDDVVGMFIVACLYIMAISAAFVFLVIFPIRNQLSLWVGLPIKWVLYSIIASACLFIIRLRLMQWQVRREPVKYGVMQVGNGLLGLLLSLLFVMVLNLGAGGRISAQIWSVSIFAVIAIFSLYKTGLFKSYRLNWRYLKEALVYGIPLMPHVGGIFLLSSADRFFINTIMNMGDVGIYMAAVQVSAGMAIVSDAINKSFVPWLFENLKKNSNAINRKIVVLTYAWFCIVMLGAVFLWLAGPSIIDIIVGSEYQGAASVIGWLALGQAFSGMYLMVTNYLLYAKRTGCLSLVTILSGLVNVLLLWILVPTNGLVGAALAFSIAMGIRFIFVWAVAQKAHPMPWFYKV